MKTTPNGSRAHTPLRDLMAAVSEAAFEYSANANEAHQLTRLVLSEILPDACAGGDGDVVDRPFFWH